jgi:hypothetical protein
LGHDSAAGLLETQTRYSHIIADARLSPMKPMADAIYEARTELADLGASSGCLDDAPTVLRRSIESL